MASYGILPIRRRPAYSFFVSQKILGKFQGPNLSPPPQVDFQWLVNTNHTVPKKCFLIDLFLIPPVVYIYHSYKQYIEAIPEI